MMQWKSVSERSVSLSVGDCPRERMRRVEAVSNDSHECSRVLRISSPNQPLGPKELGAKIQYNKEDGVGRTTHTSESVSLKRSSLLERRVSCTRQP